MKKQFLNPIWVLLIGVLGMWGCSKGNPDVETSTDILQTKGGCKYIHHLKHKGKKVPILKDMIMLRYFLKTKEGAILMDGFKTGKPVPKQFLLPPYPGAIEEALSEVSEGDSMTIFVDAEKLYSAMGEGLPSKVKKGDEVCYIIKVDHIFSPQEYTQYMKERNSKQMETEAKEMKKYFERKGLSPTPHASGLFYTIDARTQGASPDLAQRGDSIVFHYQNMTPNGIMFDGTQDAKNPEKGNPVGFVVGTRNLIPAWEIAFSLLLREGDQGTLYIPSPLAFGAYGSGLVPADQPIISKIRIMKIIRKTELEKLKK